MSADSPVMVSVSIEDIEIAPSLQRCMRCKLFVTSYDCRGYYCDAHKLPDANDAKFCTHARALNRAIEWGQQMRAMKEGKP